VTDVETFFSNYLDYAAVAEINGDDDFEDDEDDDFWDDEDDYEDDDEDFDDWED
jgi:hypothetical protein